MPHITVYVDHSEVLSEMDDDMLEREMERRRKRRGQEPRDTSGGDLADELRSAFYARNASRFEALLVSIDTGNAPVRAREMA